MRQVTYTQGKIKYVLGFGMGSWAESHERTFYPLGTTRVINGILMYLYSSYSKLFYYEYNWCPVDDSKNTPEELRKWMNKI